MRRYLWFCVAIGCSFPATRMESSADYGSSHKPTVSSAPAYEAGTNYRLTYSPDGSTIFVCAGGETQNGASVVPGETPAC